MECRDVLRIEPGVLGRVFTQSDLAQRPFRDIAVGPEEIVAIFRDGALSGTISGSTLGPGGRLLDRVKRILGRSAGSEMMYIDTSEKIMYFAMGYGREVQPSDRYGRPVSGMMSLTVEISLHGIAKLYPLVKRKKGAILTLGDIRRKVRNDVVFRAISPVLSRLDGEEVREPSTVRKLEFQARRVVGRSLDAMSMEIVRANARFDPVSAPVDAVIEEESKESRLLMEEDLKLRSIAGSDDLRGDIEELRMLLRLKRERDDIRARRARCSNCGARIDTRSGRCPACGHWEA